MKFEILLREEEEIKENQENIHFLEQRGLGLVVFVDYLCEM